MNDWLASIWANYNILGAAAALAGIVIVTKVGKLLVFSIKPLAEAREHNRVERVILPARA